MARKQVWLAFLATLLGATTAAAQGPQPMYGYPMTPYAQPMPYPMAPMPYPMAQPTPYPMSPQQPMPYPMAQPTPYPMAPQQPMPYPMAPQQPMPYPMAPQHPMPFPMAPQPMPYPMTPQMPYYPPQPPVAPPAMPANGPNGPYYLTGQPKPSDVAAAPKADDTAPIMLPDVPDADAGPSEPYTLYEGRRYRADVKNDCTRVWFQASYIHWWVRGDSPPPLVTTGTNGSFGKLGDPGTTLLLGGDQSIGPKEFNGAQMMFGMWLDDDKLCAIEVGGFWLGNASRRYAFSSDANGNPILAQPVQTPAESVLLVTLPGFFAGSINVNSQMYFYGMEANLVRNAFRMNGWSIDYFGGVRYMYLKDDLAITQNLNVLANGTIPFAGVDQGPGSNFLFNDFFNVKNRFYGGQIGARVNWTYCKWDLGATVKLGLGATTHSVNIDGTTTLNGTNTVQGSTLAQASNIGQHNSTDFSVVPEINATLGYQVTPHIRLLVGYNFLYWSRVERAANQIDRRIDFTQSPTDVGFVAGKVGTAPQFPAQRNDFWAQGINVGVELKY